MSEDITRMKVKSIVNGMLKEEIAEGLINADYLPEGSYPGDAFEFTDKLGHQQIAILLVSADDCGAKISAMSLYSRKDGGTALEIPDLRRDIFVCEIFAEKDVRDEYMMQAMAWQQEVKNIVSIAINSMKKYINWSKK